MSRISPAGLRAAVECLPSHDVRARLGEISVPTLVLVGERDEETPLSYAQALAAGIAGARLQIIPGSGHITSLEAPEVVNSALHEHLDAAEAGP
jgi:pimeloyl-ACP methyl ester carboxylesterase